MSCADTQQDARHSASCGKPPSVEADGSKYFGYFENQYGEQWVVEYDRNTGAVTSGETPCVQWSMGTLLR